MTRWLAAPALLALAAPALAQEAGTAQVTVTLEACNALVEHVPAPDVEYQPGVGADGRPVAPAEGDGHRFAYEPPERLAFPLIVRLDEFFGPGAPRYTQFADDIFLGVVTVEDGRVAVDGRPVTDDGRLLLAEACRRAQAGE